MKLDTLFADFSENGCSRIGQITWPIMARGDLWKLCGILGKSLGASWKPLRIPHLRGMRSLGGAYRGPRNAGCLREFGKPRAPQNQTG